VEVSQTGHWQQVYEHFAFWQILSLIFCGIVVAILKMETGRNFAMLGINSEHHNLPTYEFYTPTLWVEWGLYCNHLVRPSVCPSVHTFVTLRYLSFYWKKWFYIWYMALAWWLVLCLPFPGLPHIYFLFTVRLTNERVGVFLAWCSVQHLVQYWIFAVLWRPFWKFWQRRIAPITMSNFMSLSLSI
jgi:hypothetical protein